MVIYSRNIYIIIQESDKNTEQIPQEEKTVEENTVVDEVNEEEYDGMILYKNSNILEEDYSDGEIIDINNDGK